MSSRDGFLSTLLSVNGAQNDSVFEYPPTELDPLGCGISIVPLELLDHMHHVQLLTSIPLLASSKWTKQA